MQRYIKFSKIQNIMSNNIIDKIQISGQSYDVKDSSAATVVELTQQEYDNLPSSAKTSNTLFVITDAQAGDLTNYYTKTETNTLLGGKADTATTYTKTETDNAITAATSTKQDTLVSGTNIKTINNESILGSGNIDIQGGGGKAIEAGTNISVNTGETADTINCTLNISNGTGGMSIKSLGATSASANHAAAFGQHTKATNTFAFAEGWGTTASGSRSHAEGDQTIARGGQSHAEGTLTNAIADHSHSEGYASSATSRVTTMVGITTPYGWNTRHSEGYATIADNGCTHTEGLSTKALNVCCQ
jgi:hypothetical protein